MALNRINMGLKTGTGQHLLLDRSAVTQTIGFIARKGGGKTYAAGRFVEGLDAVGAPFIVVDPVGVWWGLRASSDGTGKGLEVPVLGGDRGDLSIGLGAARRIAVELYERRQPAVIDVSGFRKDPMREFVGEFIDELFHAAKKRRQPLMLVLEEAQLFAPQALGGADRLLADAVEQVVRLGRNYGLGTTLITQRPQSVSKEVLNQIECLFVGQLVGPHERAAIERWVTESGALAYDELSKLAELNVGEMLCWSPQWLDYFGRVRIGEKRTYDASATPELHDAQFRSDPEAPPLDVDELGEALELPEGGHDDGTDAAPAKGGRADGDAVKELKRRVAALEMEVFGEGLDDDE